MCKGSPVKLTSRVAGSGRSASGIAGTAALNTTEASARIRRAKVNFKFMISVFNLYCCKSIENRDIKQIRDDVGCRCFLR
jgi:hypothetical protein